MQYTEKTPWRVLYSVLFDVLFRIALIISIAKIDYLYFKLAGQALAPIQAYSLRVIFLIFVFLVQYKYNFYPFYPSINPSIPQDQIFQSHSLRSILQFAIILNGLSMIAFIQQSASLAQISCLTAIVPILFFWIKAQYSLYLSSNPSSPQDQIFQSSIYYTITFEWPMVLSLSLIIPFIQQLGPLVQMFCVTAVLLIFLFWIRAQFSPYLSRNPGWMFIFLRNILGLSIALNFCSLASLIGYSVIIRLI